MNRPKQIDSQAIVSGQTKLATHRQIDESPVRAPSHRKLTLKSNDRGSETKTGKKKNRTIYQLPQVHMGTTGSGTSNNHSS